LVGHKSTVVIHYCTQCQWQLRSVWMAQELLASFSDDLYGDSPARYRRCLWDSGRRPMHLGAEARWRIPQCKGAEIESA